MAETVSLRLKPNLLKSGEKATVRAEFLPARLLGQRCRLRLVEVDDQGKSPERVAEFTVTPVDGGGGALRFSAAKRELVDGESTTVRPEGASTPHLKLSFDGLADEHVVLVEKPRTAAEGQFFELALTLSDPGGAEVYPAGQPLPFARLDCGPGVSTGIVVKLWADPDGAGKPTCTPLELTRLRDHAKEIWDKNGFQLDWRLVTPEEGKQLLGKAVGPTQGICRVAALGGYPGTGGSVPFASGAVTAECTMEDGYVIRETSSAVEPIYYTAFLVAHEVLHQYVAYGAWYLFGERIRPSDHQDHEGMRMDEWSHESRPFEKVVEGGFPVGMQNLNCEGTISRLPARRPGGFPPIEQILHRQRRLLRTLFAEVEAGTLDEWRKQLFRWHRTNAQQPIRMSATKDLLWNRSFEWTRFYTPCAERGPGPEAPVPLLPLREHIRELEAAARAEGEARLARVKALHEGGKKAWYGNDDEDAFRKALDVLDSIDPEVTEQRAHKVRNFEPSPAQKAEIVRLRKLLESEL